MSKYEVRKRLDGTFWVVLADCAGEVFFCDCDRHEENAQRIAAALSAQAGVVEAVDWRALYEFQTAMRYMDNSKGLTIETARKMAADDAVALAAVKEKDRG